MIKTIIVEESPEASELRLYLAQQLWRTYETSRVELAKILFEEREAHRSKGGRGVAGFKTWLKKAGIPRATAYRLLAEHELSLGIREEPVSNETGLEAEMDFARMFAEMIARHERYAKEDEAGADRLKAGATRMLDGILQKSIAVANMMLEVSQGQDTVRLQEMIALWSSLLEGTQEEKWNWAYEQTKESEPKELLKQMLAEIEEGINAKEEA